MGNLLRPPGTPSLEALETAERDRGGSRGAPGALCPPGPIVPLCTIRGCRRRRRILLRCLPPPSSLAWTLAGARCPSTSSSPSSPALSSCLWQLQAPLCSQEQSHFLEKVKHTNKNSPLYQLSSPGQSCYGWHSQGWRTVPATQSSLRAPVLTQRAASPSTPLPYIIGLEPTRAGSPSLDSCPRP